MDNRRLFPAMIIGAVLGVAFGYTVHKLSKDGVGDFLIWINHKYLMSGNYDVYFWATGGAIVAATAAFMWPKNSN
jgi:hypothetical protein